LALTAGLLVAQSPGAELFEKKIRPVLVESCYGCHSSKLKAPMGDLVLDTKAGMLKGGASGPILIAGKPAESLLMRVVGYNDLRLKMPPAARLPPAVISDFEQWIASGAEDPRVDTPVVGVPSPARVIDFEKGRKWWSYQPVKQLPKPAVKNASWPRRKIDSFILAALEKQQLKPSPQADPRTLIQRAYLDLLGLRPSYEEVERFINDKSADRYEKLVDRLLASPQYGERWARYWLDVARYAENGDGIANRNLYPYAWRYRDWVIESLNKDVPYDRFIKLQLAADHLSGVPRSDLRGLGFLGVAPSEWKEFKLSKEVFQGLILDDLDERVDAVSRGFLGMTVACARCHDHKFDPISNKDYYAIAGVFASTAATIRPIREIDPAIETRYMWARQRLTDLDAVAKTVEKNPGLNPDAAAKKVQEYRAEMEKIRGEMAFLKESYPDLAESFGKLLTPEPKQQAKKDDEPAQKEKPPDPNAPFINAVYDAGLWLDGSHPDVTLMEFRAGKPHNLPVYLRGNATTPGEIVPRRFLTVLSKNSAETFQKGSGRLELAEKIVTDAAPLAARVIVNRVWGWHFDKHLVGTPSDFGDRGDKPSHSELLDDLAARFIANGWSLKWLHREIMLSATYRQSSKPRGDAEEKDPANQLLWRMNPRRLDIEAYRDSLLQAASLLNLEMFGPSLDLEAADNTRRSVYGKIVRGPTNELIRLFDFPTPFQTSPARIQTITPLQQLFVMNSPFLEKLSAALAKSVENEPDCAAKIRGLYRKALSRDPSGAEMDLGLTYINRAPLQRFAQILLATNEKIFWP